MGRYHLSETDVKPYTRQRYTLHDDDMISEQEIGVGYNKEKTGTYCTLASQTRRFLSKK